jgi:hypothetical protein
MLWIGIKKTVLILPHECDKKDLRKHYLDGIHIVQAVKLL